MKRLGFGLVSTAMFTAMGGNIMNLRDTIDEVEEVDGIVDGIVCVAKVAFYCFGITLTGTLGFIFFLLTLTGGASEETKDEEVEAS